MRRLLPALFLLTASCAFGAYARIAHTLQSTAGTNTPAINTAGADLIVVVLSYDNAATGIGVGDSQGGHYNTYTLAATKVGSASTVAIYRAELPAYVGSGHTFVCNGTSSYCQIYVSAYSGRGAGGGIDQVGAGASNTSGTIQPGSIAPSASCTNELMAVGLSTGSTSAPTISGATVTDSYQSVSGTSWGGGMADLIETSAAAFSPTWTVTSSTNAAISVSFMAADSSCVGSSTVRHRFLGEE